MNIHPGLLPKYGGKGMYGDRVHKAVLAAGEKESGCTVHVSDNEYDTGPKILERRVPVLVGDTVESLAARVFEAECEAYPEAIRLFAEGRLRMESGKVVIR
jgi:phosphoribosylglycinamide formyltransferase-1